VWILTNGVSIGAKVGIFGLFSVFFGTAEKYLKKS
jgi:hypothetical protein